MNAIIEIFFPREVHFIAADRWLDAHGLMGIDYRYRTDLCAHVRSVEAVPVEKLLKVRVREKAMVWQ